MTDKNPLFVNVAEEESKLFESNPDKKRFGIPELTNSSGTYQNPDIMNNTQQTNYQNIPVVSPNTQSVVSAQNMPHPGYCQPMPQNFGMQPMLPPVVFASEEEQEAQDEVYFSEKNYKTYAYVTKRSGAGKQKSYRPAEVNAKTKTKEYCIACFLISSVQKVTTEGFKEDTISYRVNCKYFSYKEGKEQNIAVSVPEEILHSNKLTALFRKAFGSDYIPFVPEMDKKRSDYLSKYIIQQYQKNPEEKEVFIQPDTEDISELSDMDKKGIVKDFYHAVYHNASSEMKILLLAGFGAVFMDELEYLNLFSGTPQVPKTIIIYHCQNSETQRYITALASVQYDDNQIKKLSQIQVTAQKDELQTIFFENQYHVLFFEDDQMSSYSERQNIGKIQHITEYVSKGISREETYTISCTAVIFTRRKLTEFRDFADDCIFLDAENVNFGIYSPDIICQIVTEFLALLYQNRDYFFKNNAEKIRKVLFDYSGMKSQQQNIIHIYKIY